LGTISEAGCNNSRAPPLLIPPIPPLYRPCTADTIITLDRRDNILDTYAARYIKNSDQGGCKSATAGTAAGQIAFKQVRGHPLVM
jgi:hypothetical protein